MPGSGSSLMRINDPCIQDPAHYHRVGLLAPADVDADTGYRRYTTDQIPAAQVIRRFRDLVVRTQAARVAARPLVRGLLPCGFGGSFWLR